MVVMVETTVTWPNRASVERLRCTIWMQDRP